jgi:hypothetical protein
MASIYYVYAFLQEIGEFAAASKRASRYSYVRTGIPATARGTSYLSRTAMAVNWEKLKTLIDKVFLRNFRAEFTHTDMATYWADPGNPLVNRFQVRVPRGWVASVPESVHAELSADMPERPDDAAAVPYILIPMSSVWHYLQDCRTNWSNDYLFHTHDAGGDATFLGMVSRAQRSSRIAEMLRVTHHVSKDLTMHILVPATLKTAYPNKAMYHIQNRLLEPPTEKSLGDAAVDMSQVLADHADRFDIVPPRYVNSRTLLSPLCPWSTSVEFVRCRAEIEQITKMSNADLLRWALYGDPDEMPYQSEPVCGASGKKEVSAYEQLRIPEELLQEPDAGKKRRYRSTRPEDVVITKVSAKSTGRVLNTRLVQKYLRTYMTPEEHEYLLFLCNAVGKPHVLAGTASHIRDRLFAAGIEDLHAYPLVSFDLRFRRAYYQATGINIDKGFKLQRPLTYESILSLQKG